MSTTSIAASLVPPDHARSLWRSCLGSVLRTALACAIIGCATIYSPTVLRRHLEFPAFSYVTAILIVGEATLGDTLRGAVHALYGTIQGVLPAVLSLFLIGDTRRFSVGATTLAVALSSFVVALPESTSLIIKRIALGQIVIIYVPSFKQDGHTEAFLRPIHVAASTAVGVAASVLALVFPYPRLACKVVRKKSKLYTEMSMEKLRLLVNAFGLENTTSAVASISQAKSLAVSSTKLLQDIKLKQASLQWERPPFKFLPPHFRVPSDWLQSIETPLRGMELALISTPSIPTRIIDQQLKDHVNSLSNQISLTLREDNYMAKRDVLDKTLQPLQATPQKSQDLPPFFFLFCMKLLYNGLLTAPSADAGQEKKVKPTTEDTASGSCKEERISNTWTMNLSRERLVVALKCSLTLGLSVLFGVLFSKDDGYWSGLTVAIGFTPWREATFKLANLRAQGTALGSVYGVLGSVIAQNLMELRFLVLLPWIVFTSFLRRSRMYCHAGGIAAIMSALIILGRRNYGSPTAFTIARLTETCIGLSCAIFVELLLQPTRASTLARTRLSRSLKTLNECVELMQPSICLVQLKEGEKKLRGEVNELKKFIGEAEVEPNFWFLPFPIACYKKLHGSLSKMVELVVFFIHGMEPLVLESQRLGVAWNEIQETISGDLELFKKLIGSSVKCFDKVIQVKSLAGLEMELQRKAISADLELGKPPSPYGYGTLSADEEEISEKIVDSLLQHAKEVKDKIEADEGGELKSQMVLCLATLGFCIGGLMKETRELEKGILELVQWENPSSHINLFEISCKIKEVST